MLGRLVIALALLAGPASAEAATAEKFGLLCTGKDGRGETSTARFSVDLSRSVFCSVKNCEGYKGSVEASPALLTLKFLMPGNTSRKPFWVVQTISRSTGDYTEVVNGNQNETGRCVREDYTPIPENAF